MTEPIRVLVADDHPMFRDGVVRALQQGGAIRVVAQASSAGEALRLAREQEPDLVLLDISMPGGGLQAARDIAATCPATRVAMLTMSEDEDDLLKALEVGARGYVLKDVSSGELVAAIRAVHAGEVYVAPPLASVLNEPARPRPADRLEHLTARQREVLALVVAGLGNYQIGRRLGLTEKTVKYYMTSILAKLDVRNRVEAALLANKAGLGQGDADT